MNKKTAIRIHAKSIAMPAAMLLGALCNHRIEDLETWSGGSIVPILIALMLFVTYCNVRVGQIRISRLHIHLMAAQAGLCGGVYLLLTPIDPLLAQGAMICALTPVAMSATVVAAMLGAKVATMAAFSLLNNIVAAVAVPVVIAAAGAGNASFAEVAGRLAPLLLIPFAIAQGCRILWPKAAEWVGKHGGIAFWLWLMALAIVTGRTTSFIGGFHGTTTETEVGLAAIALIICIVQFSIGRRIGKKQGDPVAGGQSLGQKNTILAVWMAQTFLNPAASIAPAAYIVWQNFVNSWQIYRHTKKQRS